MNPAQSLAALEVANQVRFAGCEVRREVTAGTLGLFDALHDPRAERLPVERLLRSVRGIGAVKARTVLRYLFIGERRLVGELTDRQRGLIAQHPDVKRITDADTRGHLNHGGCPLPEDPDDRDPDCPACRDMAA